jgi:hypothetical protein
MNYTPDANSANLEDLDKLERSVASMLARQMSYCNWAPVLMSSEREFALDAWNIGSSELSGASKHS